MVLPCRPWREKQPSAAARIRARVMAPRGDREEAWSRLARNLDPAKLESMIREIALEDVIPSAGDILQGKVRGRIVVAL